MPIKIQKIRGCAITTALVGSSIALAGCHHSDWNFVSHPGGKHSLPTFHGAPLAAVAPVAPKPVAVLKPHKITLPVLKPHKVVAAAPTKVIVKAPLVKAPLVKAPLVKAPVIKHHPLAFIQKAPTFYAQPTVVPVVPRPVVPQVVARPVPHNIKPVLFKPQQQTTQIPYVTQSYSTSYTSAPTTTVVQQEEVRPVFTKSGTRTFTKSGSSRSVSGSGSSYFTKGGHSR